MKRALLVVALLSVPSCRAQSTAPRASDAAPLDLDARPLTAFRIAGTWKRDGIEWRAIVIANVPRAELRRLSRSLHAENPAVFFDIYDDDGELPKLVAANGDDDALSTKWREAHAVGTIAGTISTVEGKVVVKSVQLYEWRTQSSTPLP